MREFLMDRSESRVFWKIPGRSDMMWCSHIYNERIVSAPTSAVPKRVFSSLRQGRSVVLNIVFRRAWRCFHSAMW
jgi:hypothetical protein